jgi:hypothetical protein
LIQGDLQRREDGSQLAVHHKQAMPTQQLANLAAVGTSAAAIGCVYQQHVKGDRKTALYHFGCAEVLVRRTQQIVFHNIEPVAKGSV